MLPVADPGRQCSGFWRPGATLFFYTELKLDGFRQILHDEPYDATYDSIPGVFARPPGQKHGSR